MFRLACPPWDKAGVQGEGREGETPPDSSHRPASKPRGCSFHPHELPESWRSCDPITSILQEGRLRHREVNFLPKAPQQARPLVSLAPTLRSRHPAPNLGRSLPQEALPRAAPSKTAPSRGLCVSSVIARAVALPPTFSFVMMFVWSSGLPRPPPNIKAVNSQMKSSEGTEASHHGGTDRPRTRGSPPDVQTGPGSLTRGCLWEVRARPRARAGSVSASHQGFANLGLVG